MIVYQCDDTLEGIFTAIYNAYEDRRDHEDTRISLTEELMLFAEYVPVKTVPEKAAKVIRSLRKQFGEDDFESICMALASASEDKAQAVYQTVAEGLRKKTMPGHLFDNLAHHWTLQAFTMARGTGNENHHLCGFVRFHELENKVLFSRIGPQNNVLTFLMPHFADRFPMENFVICDTKRGLCGIHPAGREWFLVQGEELVSEIAATPYSGEEIKYQELFKHFFHKIAIKERKNIRLQTNMLPLRFQEYMTEFD